MSQSENNDDELNVCMISTAQNETIGDIAHTSLNEFEGDLPDIQELYTKTLKKSVKLDKMVKQLTKRVEQLGKTIRSNVEDYTA